MTSILNKSFPKYIIKLPSGKKVKYRPITVREENSLLIAKQTEKQENLLVTLIEIMSNCLEDDVSTYDVTDFQYAFLNIRAKSIGEIEKSKIKCPFTGEPIDIVLDCISDIKIKNENNKNRIKLDDLWFTFKPLTIKQLLIHPNYNKSFDEKINFISDNIQSIEHQEEIIQGDDLSIKEKQEYISNLSSKEFKKIVDYYDNSSKLYFELKYTTSDGTNRNIELSGVFDIISFFLTI